MGIGPLRSQDPPYPGSRTAPRSMHYTCMHGPIYPGLIYSQRCTRSNNNKKNIS